MVNFHDPDGNLVKEYLKESQVIGPLASVTHYAWPSVLLIPLYDKYGGRPCFVVEWKADKMVVPPRIESFGMVRFTLHSLPFSVVLRWGLNPSCSDSHEIYGSPNVYY
jgi:hypothetical protein